VTTINRYWLMTQRPKGRNFDDALVLREERLRDLNDGEILIENGYLSMDAGTRMWMNAREDSYQPPTPVNSPVQGMVIGKVKASRHPDYRDGDLVRAYGQWADYSITNPDSTYVARLSWRMSDLREYLAVFGPNGWTAFLGITEYGGAKAGETVLISAAAGATGLLAGQIAKAVGARVIGMAGSDDKCSWLTRQIGFDAAINYRTQNLTAALTKACPNGINLYFDNVGGPLLDEALAHMALFGRVAVCGLIDNYDKEEPVPGPYKFDLVLMKRLKIFGFFSPDFYHRGPEINETMAPWHESGKVRMHFDMVEGLERTIDAYRKLFTGGNLGKSIVKLSDIKP
jgi:NADPH-dependent curcumin reductase CurA